MVLLTCHEINTRRHCVRLTGGDRAEPEGLHEWVEPARLESLLAEVVPRMTNQTLAQDPAEFRRKFKGLRQLYLRSHAVYSPGGTRANKAVSDAIAAI